MKRPIEILARGEVNKLLATCSMRAPSGRRDRALLGLAFGAGLRLAELLSLAPKDINLSKGTVTVLHGKGDKRRVCAFDEGTGALLDTWMQTRKKLKIKRSAPLFCSITLNTIGDALHPANIRAMIKRRARKAKLEKRVHMHGLRHSHAAELAATADVTLLDIMGQLGHGNIATTDRYVNHIAPEARINAIRNRKLPAGE